eukprot:jgi/Botrbrau1/5560/Bobra.0023s0043.1
MASDHERDGFQGNLDASGSPEPGVFERDVVPPTDDERNLGNTPRWKTWETVFTNEKAGMGGVDKEKIQKVVYEMSQGSAHFKNEEKKQEQLNERIAVMKRRAAALSSAEVAGHTRAMDTNMAALNASRDLTRTWIVVDMDAFFASVEERDDPTLKCKPMAVGGIGMISTANYVARKFGVRSAMPGFIGRQLCPDLIFVRPNFDKYSAASKEVKEILRCYDPAASSYSLDEASLDVTAYCAAHGTSGADVAAEIRKRVREKTRLTCSCGVAPNHVLAKICADFNKPDGQYVLLPALSDITAFMASLPIRKVPGIGKVTQQVLNALGIMTCSDIIDKRGLVRALFTPVASSFYLSVAMGLGSTSHGELPSEGEVGRKGISHERTFAAISAKADLEAKCEELAGHLVRDMEKEGLKGKTLTLKLKETSFAVRTRCVTLQQHTASLPVVLQAALKLLHAEMPIQIRLMGLRMANFLEVKPQANQKTLSVFVQRRPRSASDSGSGRGSAAISLDAKSAGAHADCDVPSTLSSWGNSGDRSEAGFARNGLSPIPAMENCEGLSQDKAPHRKSPSATARGGELPLQADMGRAPPAIICHRSSEASKGKDCSLMSGAGLSSFSFGVPHAVSNRSASELVGHADSHGNVGEQGHAGGSGTQASAGPSQGSIELSLRDWNQDEAPSANTMPSLGEWGRAHLPPSNHASPFPTLQHYHSGVSVTGPHACSDSPRLTGSGQLSELRTRPSEDGATRESSLQQEQAGIPSVFAFGQASLGSPQPDISDQDRSRTAENGFGPGGGLSHSGGAEKADDLQVEEGQGELLFFTGGPRVASAGDSAGQTDTFAGWLPGWTGRGMCGRAPEAADTVVVEADFEGGAEAAGVGGTTEPGRGKRKLPRTWTCAICTFAGNEAAWLRCQICESVRGSTPASLPVLVTGEDVELFAEPGAGLRARLRDRMGPQDSSSPLGPLGAHPPPGPSSGLRSAAASGNIFKVDRMDTLSSGGRARPSATPSGSLEAGAAIDGGGHLQASPELEHRVHGDSETAETPTPRGDKVGEFESRPGSGAPWVACGEEWRCCRCGETVGEGQRQEHEDRHLAMSLQLEEEQSLGAAMKRLGHQAPAAGPGKRRKTSPGTGLTLDNFFQSGMSSSR